MSEKLSIYLAGPITGQTGEEVVSRYEEKISILTDFGYVVYQPMLGKMSLRTEAEFKSGGYEHPIANDHAIFERDHWMVSISDVILVDLSNSGARTSIGTMMEMAWASHLGKHVVLVMPKENVHDHAFVRQAATIRFGDIEDAYDYLKELSFSRVGLS
jgi:nucleoside 2-deoxyribosyltransferase